MNIKGEHNRVIIWHKGRAIELDPSENINGFSEITIEGDNNTIELELPLAANNEPFHSNSIFMYGYNHFCHIASTFKFFENRIDFFNCDGSLYIGANTSMRNTVIGLGYKSDIKIGEKCMIAECNIRGSDFHSIIDIETNKVINIPHQPCYIGNNVWLAERARILKNAFIADGCIVGAESVVATQFYEKNCVIVGNPAKIVRHNTTWDRQNYLDYISKGPFIYE